MAAIDTPREGLDRRALFRGAGMAAIGGVIGATLPRGVMRLAYANEGGHGDAVAAEKLTVDLGEFYVQLRGGPENAPIRLHAGERYDVTFRNVGVAPHEVMIGRHVVTEDGRPHGYEVDFLDVEEVKYLGNGWEVEAFGLKEIELEAGEETRIVFECPPDKAGEWELGCFIPGHYEGGMAVPLIVEGQGA